MIEVRDLVFDYGSVRALKGISLRIVGQSVTALVGPHGSGKTTLLRCIAGLENPSAGRVTIDRLDTSEEPRAVHKWIGYVPESFGLYDSLSVRQILTFQAGAHGIAAARKRSAVSKAAKRAGVGEWMDAKAGDLSRRFRQRLAIAQAIVHEPRVLLLDEPGAGLDPQSRRDLSQLLISLKDSGMTVVVSSHILAGIEDYCSEMIILEEGRIAGDKAIKVRNLERPQFMLEVATPRSDLREFLAARAGIDVLEADDHHALITHTRNPLARARLIRDLLGAGFHVASFGETVRPQDMQ